LGRCGVLVPREYDILIGVLSGVSVEANDESGRNRLLDSPVQAFHNHKGDPLMVLSKALFNVLDVPVLHYLPCIEVDICLELVIQSVSFIKCKSRLSLREKKCSMVSCSARTMRISTYQLSS
jgi:hypothetical protein